MRIRWREFVFLGLLTVSSLSLGASRNWEGEVVYHIFPRSYRDSNGDGIGDFKGIVQGLPTIQRLGCTAIMLNPVAKSRVYHNYFADDMMATDPAFGSLSDFRAMLAAAHARRMKVILDMEPQYVADRHPWFAAWLKDHKSKLGRNMWMAGSPFWGSGKNWYDGQFIRVATVDLAYPPVQKYIVKVFRFWADQGVDGFRIDHMMDDLDNKHQKTGLLKGLWTPVENAVRRDHPGTFFIGEQADWFSDSYVRDIFAQTPTDAVFAFPLRTAIMSFDRAKITRVVNNMARLVPPGRTEFTFLENHDTERFASAEPDARKQRLAAALLFTLKGTPSVYYGQELGMKGIQGHGRTDGNDIPVRLAYRWGATLDDPRSPHWYRGTGPWAQPIYSKDHDGISLAEEQPDPYSLWNWYRKLIHFRLANPALRFGLQKVVRASGDDPNLLVVRRVAGSERLLIYANLGPGELIVPRGDLKPTKDLFSGKAIRESIHLAPYGFAVVRALR